MLEGTDRPALFLMYLKIDMDDPHYHD